MRILQRLALKQQFGRIVLRSQSEQQLLPPRTITKKTLGDRSFMASAPKLWNRFLSNIRAVNDLNCFKTLLITHLLRQAFIVRFYTFFFYILKSSNCIFLGIYSFFDILLVLLYSALDHVPMYFALYKYKFINLLLTKTPSYINKTAIKVLFFFSHIYCIKHLYSTKTSLKQISPD